MKTNELKMNELEQASGGNFFADLEEVLRKIFQEPAKQGKPTTQEPKVGRGKC